jgi:protein-L-isoaspartate(D-aspartate) O-methyltransferase
MTAMVPMPPARLGDPTPDRQPISRLRLGRQSPYDLARERMVADQLVARGFSNATVLDAMRTVQRHNFVLSEQLTESYEDRSLPISFNFSSGTETCTLETPYVIASVAQQLVAEPPGRVLEIGTGPAYQTAVLALLAQQVYTLDDENIAQNARANLQRFDFTQNVVIRGGDTSKGWADAAPFDTVILNRHELISADIIAQLKSNGRLIVPVENDGSLRVFQKTGGQLVNIFTLSVRPPPVPGNKVDVPRAAPVLLKPAN